MQRPQTLENMVATRRWVAQILGSWAMNEMTLQTAQKHILPAEVHAHAPILWEAQMRRVGETEIGREGIDWRIVEAKPYAKMEANVKGEWRLRMFAGQQTRIEQYTEFDGKLAIVHSPANYAESLATNNTDPWNLIRRYGGRNALADGHAVSIGITVMDGNTEALQYFRRRKGLGEYGGRLGTAAGNSLAPDITPFEIALKEAAEESRILPFITAYGLALKESGIMPAPEALQKYKQLGLASSDFHLIQKIAGGMKVRFNDRKGNEANGILLHPYVPFALTGLALNVDNDDNDSTGKNRPHHKSEYLFTLRSGLQRKDADDESFGWARNDEHQDALYVPIQKLPKFAEEHFEEMMPPTSAVTLTTIRQLLRQEVFEQTMQRLNSAYPMPQEHPMLAVVMEGRYALPELITR